MLPKLKARLIGIVGAPGSGRRTALQGITPHTYDLDMPALAMLGAYLNAGYVDDAEIRKLLMGPHRHHVTPAFHGLSGQDMIGMLREFGSNIAPHFFIAPAIAALHAMADQGADVIGVTSIRTDDEASIVDGMGGMLVRVIRPMPSGAFPPEHVEVQEPRFFCTLVNDGTEKQLQRGLRQAMQQFFG